MLTETLPPSTPFAAASSLARVLSARAETAIDAAVTHITGNGCPPRLAQAVRAAVFPGGARLRPQLCLLTALAVGDAHPRLAESAACALELLHCASLVHDDLPCFDDADTRRGLPTVHRVFGQPLAVLAGDGLIVAAFQVLAEAAPSAPALAAELTVALARAAGTTRGIVAGQAWESEPTIAIDEYHRAKTAALFEAATTMGAIAGGGDPAQWWRLGELLGRAYQAADDLKDLTGSARALGKPTQQDAMHGRPNLGEQLGLEGARRRLAGHLADALASVPPVRGQHLVRAWLQRFNQRLNGIAERPAQASG